MARTARPLSLVAAILAAACAAPAAAQNGAGPAVERSVLSGVYTQQQAADGAAVFRETCGNCHPTSQFTGAAFQLVWQGRPVFAFFDQVRMMMPMDNPGGLSAAQYTAVIAYILKLNTYPTGPEPLPTDDDGLRRIRFEPVPDRNP